MNDVCFNFYLSRRETCQMTGFLDSCGCHIGHAHDTVSVMIRTSAQPEHDLVLLAYSDIP